jgi:hypothetical protein
MVEQFTTLTRFVTDTLAGRSVALQLASTSRRARTRPGLNRTNGRPDGGYTTETVIVTALLAAAAITIVGIIVAKVIARAHSISL